MLHTFILHLIHVIIYSAEHGMDVGSEIISNRESAITCIHHTVTQPIWKVTTFLINALFQNIHKAAEQNHE